MCNLYSVTKGQQAIRELAGALRDRTGNLPPLSGIFPDYAAPIVRNQPGGRELTMARWGMPSPVFALKGKKSDPGVRCSRQKASWAGARRPPFSYLFHRIEGRLDGRPTLLIIDEGWLALDDTGFARQLREWLKTLRKKNASVIFATQSLADIETSAIAPALIESCPTRLFCPMSGRSSRRSPPSIGASD